MVWFFIGLVFGLFCFGFVALNLGHLRHCLWRRSTWNMPPAVGEKVIVTRCRRQTPRFSSEMASSLTRSHRLCADWQLDKLGYRFVRYADDFVVLCQTHAQAEEAKTQVARILSQLGLYLVERREDSHHHLRQVTPSSGSCCRTGPSISVITTTTGCA